MKKVQKGDIVQVITGKYKSKQGEVKRVLPEDGKIVVEGVNIRKRHQKTRNNVRQGGIVEFEAPINVSNVMLVDDQGEITRVGFRVENGQKVRYFKTTGKPVPNRTGFTPRAAGTNAAAEDR
jgi:large subunit ribosomal protein L24